MELELKRVQMDHEYEEKARLEEERKQNVGPCWS